MSTVQDVSSSTSFTASATTTSTQESEDRFLKLLVTQMKNQDPLNPMDNAEITSQMAQLSTVSGIEKLNATLQAMSSSFASSQSLQAASMIGRSVLAPGSTLQLQDGTAVGGFAISQPVDSAVVTIKDASGNVMNRVNLGAQQPGNIMFQWDGVTESGANAGNGIYVFEVNAVQGGEKVASEGLTVGRVGSVSLDTTGIMLNTDMLGSVEISKVKQIF